MKKKIELLGLALICFLSGVFALQPNSVETTIYNVDGFNHNVVTKVYSDGLGRPIQQKLKLPIDLTMTPPLPARDQVTCSFFDAAGRPQHATKPFVDFQNAGSFLPGGLTDASVSTQLAASNKGDVQAFSETEYWDDPLGRAKIVRGPGAAYVNDVGRSWVFGVGMVRATVTLSAVTVTFEKGFVLSTLTPEILDELTNYFLDHQTVTPVFTNPSYFLSITKDLNDKYTQEIKDLFREQSRLEQNPIRQHRLSLNTITISSETLWQNYHQKMVARR